MVEILKNITEVQATPGAQDEKYKVVSPETMQEALMTDSEDEGGKILVAAILDFFFNLGQTAFFCFCRKMCLNE